MKTSRVGASIALVGAMMLLSGCATTIQSESSMSRVKLYSSLNELTEASYLVVGGVVSAQRVAKDIDDTPFTISAIRVTEVVKGIVKVGDTVEVRQLGGDGDAPPTPIFTSVSNYLLYSTPSDLPVPLDRQYYVTGANAGIYAAKASDQSRSSIAVYQQVDPEPGEKLPSEVSLEVAAESAP